MTDRSNSDAAASSLDFAGVYERHHRAILAYCLRRTSMAADAEDAAAETFVIAWRRLTSTPDEALPWLYAIARRVLANHHRASQRRGLLLARIHAQPLDVTTPTVPATDGRALRALRRLRTDDQELLRLVAWEGLDHGQIAVVLGISVNAVAIRLHRARGRFAQAFATDVKDSDAARTSAMVKGSSFDPTPREDNGE